MSKIDEMINKTVLEIIEKTKFKGSLSEANQMDECLKLFAREVCKAMIEDCLPEYTKLKRGGDSDAQWRRILYNSLVKEIKERAEKWIK